MTAERGAWTALALLAAIAGCGPRPPAVRFDMSQHFGRSRAMYNALLSGELELARESARLVAESEPSAGLPESARPLDEAVRMAARVVADAQTLGGAARATGPLAQRCVQCHDHLETTPRLLEPDMPTAAGSVAAHMARFGWAVDRLWDGLMSGDAALWGAGIDGLLASPSDMSRLEALGEEPTALVRRLRDAARRGSAASTSARRASAFGQTIEACIACHEVARDWPQKNPGEER
ncbi:MAG: hypothetical protein MJB57_14670 [Gemmatimonadetes bacterium]|nr:hypothetical protein [Gemmatimonadota bacterium]